MKKNDKKSFLEKTYKEYGYITVLLVALVMHLVIYFSYPRSNDKTAFIILIWFIAIMLSRHCYLWRFNQNYRNRENDTVKMGSNKNFENENLDQIYPNDKYLKTLCHIVDIWNISHVPGSFAYSFTTIKYKFFDQNQKEFFGIKKLNSYKFFFVPKYPNLGDKIEIIYNKGNPNDSMIFYKKVKEHKWPYWNIYEVKTFSK